MRLPPSHPELPSHEQVELLLPSGQIISCDRGIKALVEALNLAGVSTAFSCEGRFPTPTAEGEQAYLALEIEGWCRLRDRLVAASAQMRPDELGCLERMAGGLLDCIDPAWGDEPWEWNTVAMLDLQHLRATGRHAMRLLCYFHPADITPAATLVATHGSPARIPHLQAASSPG